MTRATTMAPLKLFMVYALALPFVLSIEIRVKGPSDTITGDYEKFTCEITGNHDEVTSNFGFDWKFKLKNGASSVGMNESDVLTALEVRNFSPGNLIVSSFLRTDSVDITSVICEHSPKLLGSLDIEVKDLTAITTDNDPCAKAESSGKTIISIFMPSMNMLLPSYRRSYYIGDQHVELRYREDVNEIKLICHSPSDSPPEWSMKKEIASKMKYAVWAEQSLRQSCKQQVLHIYQVAGEPGAITNLKLDCLAGGHSSNINMGLVFPLTRTGMDFNSTENCINEIVDKFYSKELTGVGVGSSLVIVLMMVGIAMLKRQLNQQKNINQQSTSPAGNGANGGSSTEQLSPHNNQNTDNVANYP